MRRARLENRARKPEVWFPSRRGSSGKVRGRCWAQVGDRESGAEEATDAKALRSGDLPEATKQWGQGSTSAPNVMRWGWPAMDTPP